MVNCVVISVEKMLAVDCLLESFCSTRTSLNTHATRLAQLLQLHFDRFLEYSLDGSALPQHPTGQLNQLHFDRFVEYSPNGSASD